jgi:8-oxo-dGTP pyrophosphatase MutT (NUDIX family)
MNYSITNLNICNNCGRQGHLFHQCKLPITSYGVIVFRSVQNELQFLMIRRKDTFGYIDLIRGKYLPSNIYHLQNIINEMSNYEKKRILEEPFDVLWKNMWGESLCNQYKNEENNCAKKFELIKNGIYFNDKIITLKDLILQSETSWEETEWEFPKGRKNYKEKDLECALREFEEETGISKNKLSIIENILPFEETFIGNNYKSYKHKYFLAYMNESTDNINNFQISEVSKIEWKTYKQCLESIRIYNQHKKNVITNIYNILQTYKIY